MVFSSHVFIYYFLPLTLLVYYLLPRRAKHLALTLLSYVFYGWANPAFVFVMLASTIVDYACGRTIAGRLQRTPGCDRPTRVQTPLAISGRQKPYEWPENTSYEQ